jgi:hypothetical protein
LMRWVMGLAGPLLFVAVLMVFQTAPAAARSKPRPWTCEPGHRRLLEEHVKARVRLLMADAQAEVYETNKVEGAPEEGWVLAGCAYGKERGYSFGSVSDGSGDGGASEEPATLVGTLLATRFSSYSTASFGPEHTAGISVIDLGSGRTVRNWSTTEGAGIAAVVLKPDGAVAWITASWVNTETGFHQESVYADDNDGVRLLAHGSSIEDDSLALGGSTVYWLQGGIPYSAALN